MQKKEEKEDWKKIVSQNLEYYLDTEKGRKELFDMARAQSDSLIEELKKRKREKSIIWLSKHCFNCMHFSSRNGIKCRRWDCRLVKPFYGRAKWKQIYERGEKEFVISDFDWNHKSFNISDFLIEIAIEKINNGLPYFCFEPS
ncbi:MAG: hypothetical protein QXX95_01395 [Nitrososphaerales archaeon]